MSDDFVSAIENLIQKAPAGWLANACDALLGFPATVTSEFILQHLPATNNADLAFLMDKVVRTASGQMSWEALSWTINTTFATYSRWQVEQHIELLWAGPAPADVIPARRIDQALYDLIANAQSEVLLVTYAAAKIHRLTDGLLKVAQRGVHIRLILEFGQDSEGQLSYDALKAFPAALVTIAEVYHWPVEKRDRNQVGRPGKLHAKVAVVDDTALVSSANLTDDAFNRNLEVGIMVKNSKFLLSVKSYFNALVANGILCRL